MLKPMDTDKMPDAVIERAIDALQEIAGMHRTHRPVPSKGSHRWSWITILLTSVLAVGTLVGVLGRAFFVQRDEYTASENANAVGHEAVKQTLDRVDRTLNTQTQAVMKMSEAVQAQAVELAAMRRKP
jgi:cytoskeletal protein RodZ